MHCFLVLGIQSLVVYFGDLIAQDLTRMLTTV